MMFKHSHDLIKIGLLNSKLCGFDVNYAYICTITYKRACVTLPLRPFSWRGKAGAGVFSVDGNNRRGMEVFAMIQLTNRERNASDGY